MVRRPQHDRAELDFDRFRASPGDSNDSNGLDCQFARSLLYPHLAISSRTTFSRQRAIAALTQQEESRHGKGRRFDSTVLPGVC
jgi:hypothetical protein